MAGALSQRGADHLKWASRPLGAGLIDTMMSLVLGPPTTTTKSSKAEHNSTPTMDNCA